MREGRRPRRQLPNSSRSSDDCCAWRTSLLSLLFLSQTAAGSAKQVTSNNPHGSLGPTVMHFDLQPTSVLAFQQQRRRLSKNSSNKNNSARDWFHPNTNAIYATIPKSEDLETEEFQEDEDLQDFHRYRHLSRFERQYRLQNGLDLQPHWNGIYDFEEDDLEESLLNETVLNESFVSLHNEGRANGTGTVFPANNTNSARSLKGSMSSHLGGRFNNYQAVALSQGYGTHYVVAWVGSPIPQRKTLIVDTGSHYTAFPCTGCKNCGQNHHTDPYYDPEQSDTFHAFGCNDCREGVSCQDDRCVFSQSYTEGSSWEAYQVSDKFYCGGNDVLGAVDPKDQKYSIDFMFGCQLSMTGLFKTQLADGIAGFSMFETTLVKQMYNKGKLEHNIFALCYRRELGSSKRGVSAGSMTLGGVSNSLDTSPMIFARNMASVGFYTVYVKNIFLRSGGGQSAMIHPDRYTIHKIPLNVHKLNSGKGVIVDSGTTDTYLNKNMARSFNKMWKKVTGKDYAHSPISLNDEQLRSLPTILVQCQSYDIRPDPTIQNPESIVGFAGNLDPSSPTDLLIAIPATNYMEYSPRTKLYASRVYFTETSGGVLGSNTMQGHNVLFDWENGRIGFAESSCTYDRKEAPNSFEESRFSSDCALGTPILTQACVETVEEDICDNDPTNVALLGTETWTLVVEQPGTEQGLSCVETAKKLSPSTEDDPSLITCDGFGECTEHRPCQITCANLTKAKGVKELKASISDAMSSNSTCGDTYWGACDYRCIQSRITSKLFTDGNCREVERQSRVCHKDACGRSDPCRVPFIVHSIYLFPGISTSQWSKRDEAIFVESLTKTFHSLAPSDQSLFGAGDIKVLLVRPWVTGDDVESFTSLDEEHQELGVKVVVQISVFNPFVAAPAGEDTLSKQDKLQKNKTENHNAVPLIAVCKDSDLFLLAKTTRLIAYIIPEYPDFIPRLLRSIKTMHETEPDSKGQSAFSRLIRDPYLAQQSRLLSSWTIRTDVDDEINYFGPPEPLFFQALRYIHRIALIIFCFSLFVFLWGISIQSMDFLVAAYNAGKAWLPWYRASGPSYEPVETDPEDGRDRGGMINNIGDKKSTMGGLFEKSSIRRRFSIGRENSSSGESIELTSLKSGSIPEARNAKKRRNSGVEGAGETSSTTWQLGV